MNHTIALSFQSVAIALIFRDIYYKKVFSPVHNLTIAADSSAGNKGIAKSADNTSQGAADNTSQGAAGVDAAHTEDNEYSDSEEEDDDDIKLLYERQVTLLEKQGPEYHVGFYILFA